MSTAQAVSNSNSTTTSLPDKTVTLSLNAEGYAVPNQDPVAVERNQQKIRWCAPFEFQIQIEGYDDVRYQNGTGNGSECEYSAKTGVFPGTRYKYTIIANGKENDPEILVQP
jgi:hypothetical protein